VSFDKHTGLRTHAAVVNHYTAIIIVIIEQNFTLTPHTATGTHTVGL